MSQHLDPETSAAACPSVSAHVIAVPMRTSAGVEDRHRALECEAASRQVESQNDRELLLPLRQNPGQPTSEAVQAVLQGLESEEIPSATRGKRMGKKEGG